jgi:hypothetical protein
MSGLRNWKIKDEQGNTLTIVARSKTQATKQYENMLPCGRIVTIEDGGPARSAQQRFPGRDYTKKGFKAVAPVKRKVKQRPNERCACGSGKKFKKCCGRR